MNNTNDIKPWFRDDLSRMLMSIYFASRQNSGKPANRDYDTGFAAALSSVALAVGLSPETFLTPEDIQQLHMRGGS